MNPQVIIGSGSGEITEKKSRFLATVKEVHSEDETAAFLDETRKRYWDARHNCYAYTLGADGLLKRFSDDKEPAGTAGRPILDVIEGAGLRNAIIVVTRYFGGVLLGTGGLIRAYTDAANAALSNAKILPLLEGRRISFACDYKDIGRFEALLANQGAAILSKDYLELAHYQAIIEGSRMEAFKKESLEITRGAFALSLDEPVNYCQDKTTPIIYNF